jgi:hypothetical protein
MNSSNSRNLRRLYVSGFSRLPINSANQCQLMNSFELFEHLAKCLSAGQTEASAGIPEYKLRTNVVRADFEGQLHL